MTATVEKETPHPASAPLTDRQRQVYDWIVDHCETHGYSPTVREVAKAFGFRSANGAVCHLEPLRRKGWITWSAKHNRTIRPIGGLR